MPKKTSTRRSPHAKGGDGAHEPQPLGAVIVLGGVEMLADEDLEPSAHGAREHERDQQQE